MARADCVIYCRDLAYNIRAKGLMLCFFWTSAAGVFNQWVNPLGMEALEWRFYFVYIAV